MSRKIMTSYWAKPIPDRRFDWSAWYDGEEEFGPYGYGRTEDEAIRELKLECPDEDEDGLDTSSNTPISAAQLGAR